MMKRMSSNVRSNSLSEKVRELARIALASEEVGGENEIKRLEEAVTAGNLELSEVRKSACQPCLPKKGITYKSVG